MNFKKIIALVLSVSLLAVSAAACGKADPAETQKTETSAVETAAVETTATETAAAETQASETTAIENGQIYDLQFNLSGASVEVGEEFVVTVSVSSREGVVANSIALAVLTYDSYILELVGNIGKILFKFLRNGFNIPYKNSGIPKELAATHKNFCKLSVRLLSKCLYAVHL